MSRAKEVCPICEKIELDSIKSGQWYSDGICAHCMEKASRRQGLKTVAELNYVYHPDNKELGELIGLDCLCAKLCENIN